MDPRSSVSPRALALLLAALMLFACDSEPERPAPGVTDAEALSEAVTIHRDEWGVPHIYGPTDASVVFGFMYAQAEDNFWQVEDSMIQALGRYAEVNGEAALGADLLNRALEIVPLSKAEWERTDPQVQEMATAAATALNYYLATSETEPRLIREFEPWHFVAWSRFAVYQLFVFNRAGIRGQERMAAFEPVGQTASQLLGEGVDRLALGGPLWNERSETLAEASAVTGSNTWALHKERSESGNAMLFVNPHQPYFGPGQWYEGHVHSEEGLHFSGAGFFGSLLPSIGNNEHLGWSHTVNEPDIVDVYELTFDDPENPNAYRYDGGYKEATTWTEEIAVKGDAGLDVREFRFRKSHHGPIVGVRDGKHLAVRMARFEDGGRTRQYYDMAKATNLEEFKQAMSRQAQPMFNTMYADREGNIFYLYNGAVPKRDLSHDWTQPVDGSDPSTEWQGYHSQAELPQLTNPSTGYAQNCNATPFLATGGDANVDPDNYPAYMVAEDDNNRSRMSRRILEGQETFSYEDWERLTWDTSVIEAETEIPKLASALAQASLPAAQRALLGEALEHLEAWDMKSTISSTEMALYFVWRNTMVRGGVQDPVQAFGAAVAWLSEHWGSWKVAWGELNRIQRTHTGGLQPFSDDAPSLPVAGGPGNPFGMIFNFYARPEADQKRFYGVAGHSFVKLVEFSDPPRGRSIITFGQSADPASPHYFDQAELFAKQQYKPAWFSREEVEANAKRTYHPGQSSDP